MPNGPAQHLPVLLCCKITSIKLSTLSPTGETVASLIEWLSRLWILSQISVRKSVRNYEHIRKLKYRLYGQKYRLKQYDRNSLLLRTGVIMQSRTFGYARVSSQEQNLDRQIQALTDYGINERDIITDKISGKDFNRQGYLMLKSQILRQGDTLAVKELDRLGRNYEQIKDEWRELQQSGIDIVILDMPILNTREKSDLEKPLIANIVFELLAYLPASWLAAK